MSKHWHVCSSLCHLWWRCVYLWRLLMYHNLYSGDCHEIHIIWVLTHSFHTTALQWILYGRYFTAGGQYTVGWKKCVTVNIIWKVLHSRWTLVLQLEWSALQWTLYGRYYTAGGHWYCSLNEVRYSEHYMEGTSQQVDTGITAWMKCVTVNILWKILHSIGHRYFSLNEERFSEY